MKKGHITLCDSPFLFSDINISRPDRAGNHFQSIGSFLMCAELDLSVI